MAPRAALTLAWASSRAATSLAVAAAAWMLSGLTASPLLNGLLPAATTLPLLLPLPCRPRLGAALQGVAALLLLAIAARLLPLPVAATLAAVLLLAAGVQLVDLPLQRLLTGAAGVPMAALRSGAEAGRLAGNVLAGVLFPIGKALLQFSQVLVLLLPLTALVAWLQRDPASPGGAVADEPTAKVPTAQEPTAAPWRAASAVTSAGGSGVGGRGGGGGGPRRRFFFFFGFFFLGAARLRGAGASGSGLMDSNPFSEGAASAGAAGGGTNQRVPASPRGPLAASGGTPARRAASLAATLAASRNPDRAAP